MNRTRIFVSFDHENDSDLSDLITAQSKRPGSNFEIIGSGSSATARRGLGEESRSRIRQADEVVVICGELTHEATCVSVELGIAQEEDKPYMLLWGRREKMCMKPEGARPADAMYSWTPEILSSQIVTTLRNSKPIAVPEICKRLQP